jgi:hypothetical protein
VYSKIANQINCIDDYKEKNRSIDSIQTERKFFHICRHIDQLTETLEEFRTALFHDKEAGISVKELYLTSDPNSKSISLRQEYQSFNFATIDTFLAKIRKYALHASTLNYESNVWKNRQSFARFQIGDKQLIEETIQDIPQFQQHINSELTKIISISLNLEEYVAPRDLRRARHGGHRGDDLSGNSRSGGRGGARPA